MAALPEHPASQETSASAVAAPEWSNLTLLDAPQPAVHFALALPCRESCPPVAVSVVAVDANRASP